MNNLSTRDRKVWLENSILSKLGMTRERIQAGYTLLFNEIILHMCDLGRSGIRGDPRKSYYFEVDKFLNIYGM